jgi:hypothetical protein
LKNLSLLRLDGNPIQTNYLEHLKDANNLALHLGYCRIDDRSLASVRALRGVRNLFLEGNPITDAGLAHLKGLTNLTILHLEGTAIEGTGIVQLKGLDNLWLIYLDRSRVNEAALANLSGVSKFWVFSVEGTPLTEAAIQRFRYSTPDLILNRHYDADAMAADALVSESRK